jgi:HEAT repeat protein
MEPDLPPPVEQTIAKLADPEKQLSDSWLTDLSGLNSAELKPLEQAWHTIEPKRRRQIIYRLVELTEDNFELDFDDIFKERLKDEDAGVRSKAIEGLWENEEASLIEPLIDLLEKDGSEEVQAAAATALGKFALLAELEKLRPNYREKVSRSLLSVIKDQNKPVEVKRRALEAAAPLTLPQMKKAIAEAYQSDNNQLKISALFAMGKSGNTSWLPILLKELTSKDAEIRYEAAGACGELGEEEAASYLCEMVNDPDIEDRLAAIQALGKIGGPEAKGCLEKCLNHPDESIQRAAEESLSQLEAEEDPLFSQMENFVED